MGAKFAKFAAARLDEIGLSVASAARRAASGDDRAPATFAGIFSGEIVCPTAGRIAAIARALSVSVARVRSELSADGCEYAGEAIGASLEDDPLVRTIQIVGFDEQGSSGYYPRAAVETIDETVIPIGTAGLDTHRAKTSGGDVPYSAIVYRTVSAPFTLENGVGGRGAGRYVDVRIFPDHAALLDKLDTVSTSMFIAAEWEEKPRFINGRRTLVAKRFVPNKLNSPGDVLAVGGTGAGFALEAACDGACDALENSADLLQVVPQFAVEAAEDDVMTIEELQKQVAALEAVNSTLRATAARLAVTAELSKLKIKAGHEYVVEMLIPSLEAGVSFSDDGAIDATALARAVANATAGKPFIATEDEAARVVYRNGGNDVATPASESAVLNYDASADALAKLFGGF